MYHEIVLSIVVGCTASFLNGSSDRVDKASPSGTILQDELSSSQIYKNSPLSIFGTAKPDAADPFGAGFSFELSNQPPWAWFYANTGRLFGTPTQGDEMIYSDIRISVSHGNL